MSCESFVGIDNEHFAVTHLKAITPARVVLFAAGRGGDPTRHLPLLEALAAAGNSVVAPHMEMLPSPRPDVMQLQSRAICLRTSLAELEGNALPVVGIGHSIGASLLLALAGAQLWLGPGQQIELATEPRLVRLGLLAPPTGFFQAPGALDAVQVPVSLWAGSNDEITPPSQVEFLQSKLEGRVPTEVTLAEGAGHFSFMNNPPPHVTEPLDDHSRFIADLTASLCTLAAK